MDPPGNYPVSEACASEVRAASILETLQRQKAVLEDRLIRVNAAIDGLNKHPEVAEVLELVAKAR